MKHVGYTHLIEHCGLVSVTPIVSAEIRPVTRIQTDGKTISVPAKLVPPPGDRLGHLLFALKHEGINLQVLAQVLPTIPEPELRDAVDASPNSQYLRKAGFLWEHFTGETVHRQVDGIRQTYVPLFDPKRYITGPSVNNPRWRIRFNGLGSLHYCAIVRRTDALEALLEQDFLHESTAFFDCLPNDIRNRTLAWAYWREAIDSYAIEQESPAQDKALRFVKLLKKAHHRKLLDEQRLVALQNTVLDNTHSPESSFREQQNHLSDGVPGPLGITYVPPEPALCRELMDELIALANLPGGQVDPVVLASVVSLGFAFIHPFIDGNGRLSRFLFHHVLCQQGALRDDQILPISIVLREHQADYLAVLQAYSWPVRQYWNVRVHEDEHPRFEFKGHPSLYQYWDATDGVELMAGSIRQSLKEHLAEEVVFLNRYDRIYRLIDQTFDVSHMDLTQLVRLCLNQKGRISPPHRAKYQNKVPPEVFDALEQAYRRVVVPEKAC